MPFVLYMCAACGEIPDANSPPLLICSDRKMWRYCSKASRQNEWRNHKASCAKLKSTASPEPLVDWKMEKFIKEGDPISLA